MKKFLSVIMIIAVLLSCCACNAKDAGKGAAAAPTLDPQSPEAMYGHIDQTVPMDGYYKIWNTEGVKFMMENHPDGKFEILCNIDMQGATLAPIGEFTGTIKGGNFTISNFVLQGDGESFGFVAVNKGTIQNFLIDGVTFLPGANAKNIGALAGVNEGKINRGTVNGVMTVEAAVDGAACGGVVGTNTGTLANVIATVEMTYTAPGAAKLGGLVGVAKGGSIEFLENHGKLTVTGSNKTVGLFAGEAADAVFKNCVFGGADNSLDGKLFTNFTGNVDDDELVVAANAKWRDNAYIQPLPEKVMAVREKVVDAMYKLCTVEWHVKQDLVHSCTCQLSSCHGTYNSIYTYYGIPYNHKSSSLARFTYCLNEDKSIFDWFYDLAPYDGFDIYIGGDCSSTVQQAWWTVSNSTDIRNTRYIPEVYGQGTTAVGDYVCDFELKSVMVNGTSRAMTDQYINATEEQVMYESYAQTRPGDAIVNQVEAGGHTRMIAADPVIIRDQAGNIDPTYSYVLCHEQGSSWTDEVKMETSSCKTNWKYTFANLYSDWYVPVTCDELLTGTLEPAEAKMIDGCQGYSGMFTGTVKANYQLDYVKLTVTNSKGEEVLDHPMFTSAQKVSDYGGAYYTARVYTDSMDMADFAVVLANTPLEQGESYNYTVTACLATYDSIVVNEGNFVYGA